jgi:hypothetical protein
MTDRRTENARTLASLLKVNTAEAAPLLDVAIAVRADPADAAAMAIAGHLQKLLSHTVADVPLNVPRASIAAEVVIGAAAPTISAAVRVHISPDTIRIGPLAPADAVWPDTHCVLLLAAACYAAGAVLRAMFGAKLQVPGPAASIGLTIPIIDIVGPDQAWLSAEFELTDTYLAGAGAIGNGFLYALSLLRASGTLAIVDPDIVSDGNLNRCVWFTAADVELPKAIRLSELAQPSFPRLHLIPKTKTLQQVGKEQPTDTWLKRLIVAVDSRRTRRHLQHEIPSEVFDASTTGAVECVLHHHVQPTDHACLACIYHETPDELAREQHMAETLGVALDDVKQHYVSPDAARRIHVKYPHVAVEDLEGQAFDTLFKALCSEGRLLSANNRQVLAPFAFVSVLAGTYLAIELGRRMVLGQAAHDFNYWRISPWAPPFVNMRDVRRRREDCEFCGQPLLLRTARGLWGPLRTEKHVEHER